MRGYGRRRTRRSAGGWWTRRRLQGAGYDLDEVTPDADDWKYRPMY
jgi:hypothetical protein